MTTRLAVLHPDDDRPAWDVDADWSAHRHVAVLFKAVTCLRVMEAMADTAPAYDWAAGAQTAVLRALATSRRSM